MIVANRLARPSRERERPGLVRIRSLTLTARTIQAPVAHARGSDGQSRRRGVVLIAVLLVVVLLALAAYQFSEMMTSEAQAVNGSLRMAQARAFADSGVHYAAALLSDRDSFTGTLNSNPYDNEGSFRDIVVQDSDKPRMQGRFSLVAPYGVDEGTGTNQFRFGVTDESGKVNLNSMMQIDPTGQKLHDILIKLPNMTEEIADAIVDWLDADDEPRANGAESTYYASLSDGYRCKNGPLDSLEELLLVRGVTPMLLFGTDRNRNGNRDNSEQADSGGYDRGWSVYLTVYSRELNFNADYEPRIYLNDKDTTTLGDTLTTALGDEMAAYILMYKTYGPYAGPMSGPTVQPGGAVTKTAIEANKKPSKSVPSIFALIGSRVGITQPIPGGGNRQTMSTVQQGPNGSVMITNTTTVQTSITKLYECPLNDSAKSKELLPKLLDLCTTQSKVELPARINVNTAPQAVLAALPGLEDADVQAIIQHRPGTTGDQSDATYQSVAWLLTEASIKPPVMQALERYITTRSQVYRVQSLGVFDEGGPAARVEAVIDTNAGKPRIVYWRDLTELGRGYNLKQ